MSSALKRRFNFETVAPIRDMELEVKLVTETDTTTIEQELADYREVEGIKIPFVIRTSANGVKQGEIRLEKVEFNVKLDDAIFRMPKGGE